MTDPLTPNRLTELLNRHENGDDDTLQLALDCLNVGINVLEGKGRDNWIRDLKQYQADHVALIGEIDRLTRERDRLHNALSEVLASGGPEFDGEVRRGFKRTLWITPERLQCWREVLATSGRSERDGAES